MALSAQPASDPADRSLLRQDENGVTTLTLNRPAERNGLSSGLMGLLQRELDAINKEQDVRVVVIGAKGPVFCAGHDLKEIRENPSRARYESLFKQCSRLMLTIVRLRQPVIAKVHGMATAAGCQLVATCDLAIAGASAKFCTPGVNIGLFCSTPMVALSRNVPRKRAMEMLLTGDAIDAERAAAWGLINRSVPDEALEEAVRELSAQIVSKSPLALAVGKEAFYRQSEMNLAQAYDYASEVMTRNMMAFDAEEGIEAFLRKRKPNWKGR